MATQPEILSISPAPLLQIRDLTVEYAADGGRSLTPALHKVGLDIWAGETVGILGESGAGKSSLASTILGMLPPNSRTAGSILFQSRGLPSQDLLRLDEAPWRAVRGAKIAMSFQEPGLRL